MKPFILALVLLFSSHVYAEIGDTFEALTPEGVTMLFEVTGEDEVQVGRSLGRSIAVEPSTSGSLTIPSTVVHNETTYRVTSIFDNALYGCRSLTSVVIPASVTSIGTDAFEECSGLTSVEIPDGVTRIGSYAFRNCCSLTSVRLLGNLTAIGNYVFTGCSSITHITINCRDISFTTYSLLFPDAFSIQEVIAGKDVAHIDVGFFRRMPLTALAVVPNNPVYDSRDNCNAIIETATNTLIRGCRNTVIPGSVTRIGDGAFSSCSTLKSINLPRGLTSIGKEAFMNCSQLESIQLPDGITTIPESAFTECCSLTSFKIPDSVTSIGQSAFRYCTNLTSVVIPGTVTSIGATAFEFCSSLPSVEIPECLTTIEFGVFLGCTNLTSVVIPSSVTSIGLCAFENCSSLTSVVIPSSVTSIGSRAFSRCSNLESIEIPSSVTSIGGGAFHYTKWYENQEDGVIYIGPIAYYYKGPIADVVIKDGTTSLSSFAKCWNLKSVVIPGSVKEIPDFAFQNCIFLTSATIDDGVTVIGEEAFKDCKQLASVTIAGSVKEIGNEAFYGCELLTSVLIPGSVEYIGNYAFYYCNNLRSMYVEWQSPILIGQNVIMPSNQITLYVPQGTKAVYEEAPYWKGCKEIVEYNLTGIESISGKPLNPHSIIRADTPVFTLDGKPVPRKAGSRLSQGLYIVGGKKVVVR